jgi:RNA polymerase sigma-70 factor (ECF subfamily)
MAHDAAERPSPHELESEIQSFHAASFGWAMACCRWRRDEAEEVLQTSYVKAIEGRARFNGHSSIRTWFFGVVKHTAAEGRRRRALRGSILRRWFTGATDERAVPTPEQVTRDGEAQARVRRLLSRLSKRQRELLHLVFYQELTIEQAAEVLHISVGSARTHYERGKARLRDRLADNGVTK